MVHKEMVTVNEFSHRLLEAIEAKSIKRHGAGNWLASLTGVTVKAANKWLNGESQPRREKLEIIAKTTGVRVEWLQFGVGSKIDNEVPNTEKTIIELLNFATPRTHKELIQIAKAAEDGRLTEQDVQLLKLIADRLTKKD